MKDQWNHHWSKSFLVGAADRNRTNDPYHVKVDKYLFQTIPHCLFCLINQCFCDVRPLNLVCKIHAYSNFRAHFIRHVTDDKDPLMNIRDYPFFTTPLLPNPLLSTFWGIGWRGNVSSGMFTGNFGTGLGCWGWRVCEVFDVRMVNTSLYKIKYHDGD